MTDLQLSLLPHLPQRGTIVEAAAERFHFAYPKGLEAVVVTSWQAFLASTAREESE